MSAVSKDLAITLVNMFTKRSICFFDMDVGSCKVLDYYYAKGAILLKEKRSALEEDLLRTDSLFHVS